MEYTVATDLVPGSPSICPEEGAAVALRVSGMVPRPTSFSANALKEFARRDLGPTEVLCFTGRPVAQVESYTGVRLTEILDACGFSEQPRSDLKRCVIVAVGQDGYEAVFSWSELYNAIIGERVLVLYERNARALDAHMGRLCLISANDSRLGPRHLRGLFEVRVIHLGSSAVARQEIP